MEYSNQEQNDSLLSHSTSQDSILHRKRELRGIPGSFSSNLGQRNSPSPPRVDVAKANNGSRRVRSIVAWIESSSTGYIEVPDEGAAASTKPDMEESPPRVRNITTEACDDSLAFLNYRHYFTEQPLVRCLDEGMGEKVSEILSETRQIGNKDADDYPRKRSERRTVGQQRSPMAKTRASTKRTRAEIVAF
ncbi:hypothetical protein K4F52_007868 [Lecanicillium sp. MT-2017a]|nr:hypothetical protein K4F52_007868 [Lecanicillium sp. MT-2017a]